MAGRLSLGFKTLHPRTEFEPPQFASPQSAGRELVRVRSSEKNRETGPQPCVKARLVEKWPPERRPLLRILSPTRSVTPFAPLVSPARTWSAKGWRRLARDKVPTLGIPSQSRPDKFSAKPSRKLLLLPEPSVPADTLSSCTNGWNFHSRIASGRGDGVKCGRIF